MKKVATWLLILAMVVSLAGCGGGNNGTDEDGNTIVRSGNDLAVAIWDNNQLAGLQEIAADFTAATGIGVTFQVITWDSYWTLLEAGASGGDMPDVFWMHSNEVQRYMSNDILLDLTDRIAQSDVLEMDKFPDDIKEFYEYEEKIYAVPKDIDTIALWYNKTMFDEAGLDYPDDTWTWDDFYEAALRLTKEDGSQYGWAMNPSNDQDGFYNIIYSMGGYVINDEKTASGYDDPNTIRAMEFIQKSIQTVMPSYEVMAETGTEVLFNSGQVAMMTQGSWMVPGFKENEYVAENCDVAIMPKDAETGKRVSIYNGLGWAASAKTSNPEGAWKLIEWFGSKDMQEKQAELGVTMAAYEGVSDIWKNCTDKFNLQPYLDMLEDTDGLVFRPASRATTTWANAVAAKLKLMWSGYEDPETACKAAAEVMNEKLANEHRE